MAKLQHRQKRTWLRITAKTLTTWKKSILLVYLQREGLTEVNTTSMYVLQKDTAEEGQIRPSLARGKE